MNDELASYAYGMEAVPEQTEARGLVYLGLVASVNIWGGIVFGYNTGIIATALDPIDKEYGLTSFTKGVVTSSVLLGAMVGSLVGGWLCDAFGRKKVNILSSLLVIAGALSSAFSPASEFWVLPALRVILGLGVGLISQCCPSYVSEMSPSKQRGIFGSLFQLFLTFAILLAYVVGYGLSYLDRPYDWRSMLGVGAAPGVVSLIVAVLAPESTVWLQKKKDRINVDYSSGEEEGLVKDKPHQPSGLLGLFARKNWSVLLVGLVLPFALQLTGINAVIYYAPTIFENAGVSSDNSIFATMGVGAWNFITTFIAVGFVERTGRRPLVLGGLSIMVVSEIVLGFSSLFIPDPYSSYISMVCVFVFIAGFEAGVGCLFWVVVTEIFPEEVKDAGVGLVNGLQWGFNLLLAMLFLLTVDNIGLGATYLIFGGVGVFTLIYLFFCLPETKTKTFDDSLLN